jgi:hypothetical protein
VAFYVNGTLLCADDDAAYACTWVVPSARGVQYTIEARAYDIMRNTASSTVKVTSN